MIMKYSQFLQWFVRDRWIWPGNLEGPLTRQTRWTVFFMFDSLAKFFKGATIFGSNWVWYCLFWSKGSANPLNFNIFVKNCVPPAAIQSSMLRCHSRSLGTKYQTKIVKFWGFTDPSNQNEQYTTPYYPKYEICDTIHSTGGKRTGCVEVWKTVHLVGYLWPLVDGLMQVRVKKLHQRCM